MIKKIGAIKEGNIKSVQRIRSHGKGISTET